MGQLSRLQWLPLNNNHLTALTAEIALCFKDLDFKLDGNLLENIPEELKQRFEL
ncbi:hypothetical protein NEOC65_001985 [Neochlamydia sp. AcF65]|nr:hypothetical protein [Neochlamydia sp. AcF65]MBS4170589.1 hypothetical protein [Neochlamydia sp. AcF95]NGY94245.1 hypothetical protein [Neochlamydia sp. AcF84]